MKTVLYNILQEEKQRNLKMQEAHLREIMALPKGSVIVKNVAGNNYYYLKYRLGNKIKTDYLGKDEKVVKRIKLEIEKRKYLQDILKRLRLEYKQICKVVKE